MANLKKCEKCDKDIYTNIKKCPYCGALNTNKYKEKDKPKNILVFFIKMVLLFILVDLFVTIIPVYLGESILKYKYGQEFVVEALWCLCIVIILLLSGNSYVFTEKKEKFGKAVFLGLPMLIMGGSQLLGNLATIVEFKFWNFMNLILFCASIGLTEEFLCRGWVQNEFIERFGDTRKNVIISIMLSSLVFGLMHITNIFAGQGLFETIMQILQATSLGALLGSIYYRTKNIWAVAFLHGFYDFGIFLYDIDLIKDCTTGTVTPQIMAYQIFSSALIIAFYTISTIIILRKKDTHKIIDENSELSSEELEKDQKRTNYAWIAIAIIFALFYLPIDFDGYDDYQICYSYEEKEMNGYETHFSNYSVYDLYFENKEYINSPLDNSQEEPSDVIDNWGQILGINENDIASRDYKFELFFDENESKLAIKNMNTNDIIYIDNENIYDYIVIYDNDEYIIMYYDNDELKVYYTRVKKDKVNDSKEFLEEIKNSFKEFDVPEIASLGYLTTYDDENDYTYAYMISELGDQFIIDNEDNLYLIK